MNSEIWVSVEASCNSSRLFSRARNWVVSVARVVRERASSSKDQGHQFVGNPPRHFIQFVLKAYREGHGIVQATLTLESQARSA